jgi:hypothetical protein
MRILLSCLQSTGKHDIPAYEFWRSYFIEGCREAGIEPLEVPDVDWAGGIALTPGSAKLKSWKDQTWEKTLRFAREQQSRGRIDFFLSYLYPWQVEEAAIRDLRTMGIPCANFFCDNLREFRRVPEAYKVFDLHWVPEYEALPMYVSAGLPQINLPMPCWVPERLRQMPAEETEPVTFIGSADILRRELLGEVVAQGAAITLRGPGWGAGEEKAKHRQSCSGSPWANQIDLVRRHGWGALAAKAYDKVFPLRITNVPESNVAPAVFGEDYFRVTREARVTLGVNRVPVTRRPLRFPLAYSRLRDIEAPMLGACYLTEHTSGVEQLYDVGNEIETYRSADELVAKLGELEKDKARRTRLRIAGQRKALQEHSVARSLLRISTLLNIV